MEHSFKLTKVFIIMAVILILVTLGVIVFKNTDFFVKGNSDDYEIGESNEFNLKFENYKGKQTGAKLKGMAEKLINNINENSNNSTMLPDVIYVANGGDKATHIKSTVEKNNVKAFEEFKSELNSKHTYFVKFVYSAKTDLITGIIVQYEQKAELEFVPDEN